MYWCSPRRPSHRRVYQCSPRHHHIAYRCSPYHPLHSVPVLATSSQHIVPVLATSFAAYCTQCSPRHPPHSVLVLATPFTSHIGYRCAPRHLPHIVPVLATPFTICHVIFHCKLRLRCHQNHLAEWLKTEQVRPWVSVADLCTSGCAGLASLGSSSPSDFQLSSRTRSLAATRSCGGCHTLCLLPLLKLLPWAIRSWLATTLLGGAAPGHARASCSRCAG